MESAALEPVTLRARWVLPVAADPIGDGTVTIRGERIATVGKWRPAMGNVQDLGDVALLPGLVNAHTHLEFSELPEPLGGRPTTTPLSPCGRGAGGEGAAWAHPEVIVGRPLREPGVDFCTWIRRVMDYRRQLGASGPRAVREGIRQCVRLGITTLGEIAQPDWPLDAFQAAPLDATIFLELIAPTADRVEGVLQRAESHLRIAAGSRRLRLGLSPHAPYSVHPELLVDVVAWSGRKRFPLAMHLAESREEMELLATGRGPLADLLAELNAMNGILAAGRIRVLDCLEMLARADRALVIHGNYLGPQEIAFLAEHRDRMAVVYCPRTHALFGHDPYPLEQLLGAGATVALGTDSRASSPDLSILAEMRHVARAFPSLPRGVILGLGTLAGANALGLAHETGSIEPGKYADLAAVAIPSHPAGDPHDLLLGSNLPVVGTWFRGRRTNPELPAASYKR